MSERRPSDAATAALAYQWRMGGWQGERMDGWTELKTLYLVEREVYPPVYYCIVLSATILQTVLFATVKLLSVVTWLPRSQYPLLPSAGEQKGEAELVRVPLQKNNKRVPGRRQH